METQVFGRSQPRSNDDEGDDDAAFEERQKPIYTADDSFERGAAFDGMKLRVSSQKFRHGRVTAVLSGITIDLRDAALSPEGATIAVQSALCGIDILVPPDWEVVCDVDAVWAGIDGGRVPTGTPGQRPKLRVTGVVVAGGLCVR